MGTSIADAHNPSRQLKVNEDGSINISSSGGFVISSSATLPVSDNVYALRQEFTAMGLPLYLGESEPGTLVSTTGWRIRKFTYENDTNLVAVEWADGTASFDKIWDNRKDGTYTYS